MKIMAMAFSVIILAFLVVIFVCLLFKFVFALYDFAEWIGDRVIDIVEWAFDTFERMWQR